MLSVVMLNVVMLNGVMLSVLAPFSGLSYFYSSVPHDATIVTLHGANLNFFQVQTL